MTDAPQGPDWFQATDGKWYPPAQPGQPPPQVVVVQQQSNTGKILAIIAIVLVLLCALPVVAILAVTFLGRASSSKFSSVGSAVVGDIRLQTTCLLPLAYRFRLRG